MSERSELLEANLLEEGDRIITPTGTRTVKRVITRGHTCWISWEGIYHLTRCATTDRFETIERN